MDREGVEILAARVPWIGSVALALVLGVAVVLDAHVTGGGSLIPAPDHPAASPAAEITTGVDQPPDTAAPHPAVTPQQAAYETALQTLYSLAAGDTAFMALWKGGATESREVEVVVVTADGEWLQELVHPQDLPESAIMAAVLAWVAVAPLPEAPAHRFVEDEHLGLYHNVVLDLTQGLFWMQFDDTGRVTKLWLEYLPLPEPLLA